MRAWPGKERPLLPFSQDLDFWLRRAEAGSGRARHRMAGRCGQARAGCGRGARAARGRHAGRGEGGLVSSIDCPPLTFGLRV